MQRVGNGSGVEGGQGQDGEELFKATARIVFTSCYCFGLMLFWFDVVLFSSRWRRALQGRLDTIVIKMTRCTTR